MAGPLLPNLVLMYQCDEQNTPGADLLDAHTNSRDGIFSGPLNDTNIAGIIDRGRFVNRLNNIVFSVADTGVSDPLRLNALTGGYGFSAWCRPNTFAGSSFYQIVGKLNGAGTFNYRFTIDTGTLTTNSFYYFDMSNDGSTSAIIVRSTSNPTFGNTIWEHVAVSFDPVAGTATIWVNGTQEAQTTGYTGTPNSDGTAVEFFTRSSASQAWDGSLDLICVFNRPLDQTDVDNLYGNGTALGYPLNISGGPVTLTTALESRLLVPQGAYDIANNRWRVQTISAGTQGSNFSEEQVFGDIFSIGTDQIRIVNVGASAAGVADPRRSVRDILQSAHDPTAQALRVVDAAAETPSTDLNLDWVTMWQRVFDPTNNAIRYEAAGIGGSSGTSRADKNQILRDLYTDGRGLRLNL